MFHYQRALFTDKLAQWHFQQGQELSYITVVHICRKEIDLVNHEKSNSQEIACETLVCCLCKRGKQFL